MGKVLAIVIVALLGFYVAWPAYSLMSVQNALNTENVPLLAAKVDFPQVRQSLTPAVTAEVEKAAAAAVTQGGADNAALLGQLKTQMVPKIVELALTTIVTPESLMRIYREGGDVRKTISDIVSEKMGSGAGGLGALAGVIGGGGHKTGGLNDLLGGKFGGLLGKKDAQGQAQPAPPVAAKPAAKAAFSIANIKRFSIMGPLGFSVGVAKDAAATVPDVETDIAFTGLDWKIVGVRPRI
ncbi:MAG: DUF2939 domain-containing protein [Hyphomicrobiaceae bacterium]